MPPLFLALFLRQSTRPQWRLIPVYAESSARALTLQPPAKLRHRKKFGIDQLTEKPGGGGSTCTEFHRSGCWLLR